MIELDFTKDNEKMKKAFSTGFKSFIKRKLFTPKQISECLGVSESAVNGWKFGRSFPDVPNLFKLIELGLSISEVSPLHLPAIIKLNDDESQLYQVTETLNNLFEKISSSSDQEQIERIGKQAEKLKTEISNLEKQISTQRETIKAMKVFLSDLNF